MALASEAYALDLEKPKEVDMCEEIKSEAISRRRVLSLLGLAATLGLAVPTTVLTVSDAEAQTTGMKRRDERRKGRAERRQQRRTGAKAPAQQTPAEQTPAKQ